MPPVPATPDDTALQQQQQQQPRQPFPSSDCDDPADADGSNTKVGGGGGIDLRAALSILSTRAESGGDVGLREEEENVPAGVAEERRGMGQSIDDPFQSQQWTKMAEEGGGGVDCGCGQRRPGGGGGATDGSAAAAAAAGQQSADEALIEEERKALDERRKENEAELRSKLDAMSVGDLLGAVFEAQKERTVAYREYDRGLDTVLSTGNITNYPAVVASATASFSVLSGTINAIRSVLYDKHGRKDVTKLIRGLQQGEKEKLNATAALHLERIREKNEALGMVGGVGEGEEDYDGRVHNLLREGVVTLRAKVAELVETINETLEELRYAAAEEE